MRAFTEKKLTLLNNRLYLGIGIRYIVILCIKRVSLKKGVVTVKVNKELLKGSTVTLVLSVLSRQDMYGYGMIKEIEKKSSGVFELREGTLYPILHSLEAEGMVESYWEKAETGRNRKYYKITAKGKNHLEKSKREWNVFSQALERVIWGGIVWA